MLQTQDSPRETAAASIEAENPATGKVVAKIPVVAPEDVAERVARARRAQPGWEALGFEGRAAVMKRCRKWIVANQERVIDTIVSETGKAYEDALFAEVSYAEAAFAFWVKNAEQYLAEERVKTASPFAKGRKLIVRYAPLGVVGVIGPWNYPLTNSFGDCIPALMAGNSVLLKPSEVTPLNSMLLGEMLRECGLPEDVYQVVPGYGETGQEPIYDRFVEMVTERVRGLRQGVPGGPGSTDLGAVINPPQSDIVERHVKDAVEQGARVLVGGGRRDENGHYFEPTVLVDVDHSMACMREETFGPTVPIMKVRDAEEAVRLANDTPYGLQASVWTKDAKKGERLARRVEAGAGTVNDAQVNYVALELPLGGWKESGLGTRHGADGIRKYTKKQSLLVTSFAPMKKDLHMMPYTPRRTRFLSRLFKLVYGR